MAKFSTKSLFGRREVFDRDYLVPVFLTPTLTLTLIIIIMLIGGDRERKYLSLSFSEDERRW